MRQVLCAYTEISISAGVPEFKVLLFGCQHVQCIDFYMPHACSVCC